MENNLIRSRVASWMVCLPLILAGHAHALLPLSNSPLFLGGNISPNVMFTLDDSGSMHWEIMPDDAIYSYFMFPRASSVYNSGSDYSNYVPIFADGFSYSARTRSPQTNPIYYNPAVTYQPWSNSDGSLMPNAVPTAAFHNPTKTSAGSRNLTVNNTQSAGWDSCNNLPPAGCGYSSSSKTFYPAVYFFFNGGDEWNWNNYTKQEIRSNIPSYSGHGRSNRSDCTAGVCTYDEEIQNFANWYTYYRSRILLARAGIGKAFSAQGNTMRVGFGAINKGETTVDGGKTDVVITGVRQFTGTDRTNFFTNLYEHPIPTSGTPLRSAIKEVGKYYERADDKGPWGETPGSTGGTQHECRQNYNILMTDGFWNGSSPSVGNTDNSAGASINNDSSPATPPAYTYTPALPYSDSYSNTLADVAMHYWKRDLRADMQNKVPTNPSDPAFWQHMVTFTVGLGVSGSLATLPSGAQAWPDPSVSDAAKIDDLWHAAVNGRGNFFSAADPGTFAEALTNSLSSIVSRTGSASAVAANSNSLMTNGRIYQAKFNSGDWSGQLLSIPIDSVGNLGATEWNAADISLSPGTINPASRVIVTKGSSDGVAFEYANLTAVQKALLDKNVVGIVDNCGLERVDFLRGDAVKEGVSGTFSCASATVVNKFRSRTTSKLGDIVNSGPFYVGRPNAGHSDVDHPGYAAFSADYKDRLPIVYVGANDGSLHGFSACIPGVTAGCAAGEAGKEMITYVPSMVFSNLSRLLDKDYNANHRYFVDGSPMVADAYTGAIPSWKSVLVGSLNGGGRGYYALNVTNPTDGAQSEPNFTEANAAALLLWEFTDSDDIDMGYSHNLPPVNPFTGQAQQIVKMENGQWAVVVGNGYNSIGGKAVLYVLFITGGEDGSWTADVDYIKLTADPGILVGGVGGNGLSTPMPFDSDGNGLVDVIYAGDLKGNLWKFDVSSSTPALWKVALEPTSLGLGGLLSGDTPLFAAGSQKPIISPPVVSLHPQGGLLVMFGTGKYLETGDTTNTDAQTIYAVWDHNTTATVSESDLVEQVLTDGAIRTATQNLVNYSATVKGWYMDLPVGGERLTGIPALEDGLFTFTTIIPSTSPCDFGGRGFVNTVDFLTGGMLPFAAFDINRNGIVAFNDGLSAGVEIGFSVGGVTRIRGHANDVLISSRADGTLVKTPATKGPAGLRGRITWRELFNNL